MSFLDRKMAWLEAVACDGDIPPLARRIVELFVARYLNGKTEKAWMRIAALAKRLNRDRRNVRRALDYLVKEGWLDCEVSRGRGNTNKYLIPSDFEKGARDAPYYNEKEGATDPLFKHKRGRGEPEKGARDAPLVGDTRRYSASPNVRRGVRAGEGLSFDGPGRQGGPPAKRARGQSEGRERKQKTPFPTGWQCGPAEEEAAAEIAGWDAERVREEFVKFKDWALDEDVRSRNWPRVWIAWCKKGLEFDQREAEQRARGQNGSGSRRGNGRADQVNATNEALHGLYEEYARRAQQAKGD